MENIIVINIPSAEADATFLEWAGSISPFFAETCGRQLLVCTREAYEQMPEEKRAFFEKNKGGNRKWVYEGYDGFQRMLEVYCGLHSDNPKDYNICGQIRENWTRHQKDLAEHGRKPDSTLVKFCDALFHDGKMVKSALLDPVIESEDIYAILAQLLHLNGKQKVLVIADTYGTTGDVCRGLGKQNTRNAQTIVLTHMDEQQRRDRNMEMVDEKSAKRVVSEIKTKPFADCIDDIMTADHVVICTPMCTDELIAETRKKHGSNFNRYPDNLRLEETIMNGWCLRKDNAKKHKKDDPGKLVQVRGCPQLRNGTTDSWNDFKELIPDGSIIVRSDLDARLKRVKELNKMATQVAFNVVADITKGRRENQRANGLNVSCGDGFVAAEVNFGKPQLGHRPDQRAL